MKKLLAMLLLVCLFIGMIPTTMAAAPQTLYLKVTSGMTAKVTFTDHNNKAVTADAVIEDGIVIVDQIVVADARQLVTVTVYNANGSVDGSATDSLESCVARANQSDAIYQATMKFADSTYNYLH